MTAKPMNKADREKWYAEAVDAALAEQAEQEPNTITFRNDVQNTWVMRITADRRIEVNEGIEVTEAAKLVLTALEPMLRYAAPVRIKDLTDDEIISALGADMDTDEDKECFIEIVRLGIAADREKNK